MLRHSRYPSQPTRTIMVQVDFVPSATFPYFHSIILAIVCFTTAISITGLFSYVGFMILDFGVTTDENKAGYYAGYIGSAFMYVYIYTTNCTHSIMYACIYMCLYKHHYTINVHLYKCILHIYIHTYTLIYMYTCIYM